MSSLEQLFAPSFWFRSANMCPRSTIPVPSREFTEAAFWLKHRTTLEQSLHWHRSFLPTLLGQKHHLEQHLKTLRVSANSSWHTDRSYSVQGSTAALLKAGEAIPCAKLMWMKLDSCLQRGGSTSSHWSNSKTFPEVTCWDLQLILLNSNNSPVNTSISLLQAAPCISEILLWEKTSWINISHWSGTFLKKYYLVIYGQ